MTAQQGDLAKTDQPIASDVVKLEQHLSESAQNQQPDSVELIQTEPAAQQSPQPLIINEAHSESTDSLGSEGFENHEPPGDESLASERQAESSAEIPLPQDTEISTNHQTDPILDSRSNGVEELIVEENQSDLANDHPQAEMTPSGQTNSSGNDSNQEPRQAGVQPVVESLHETPQSDSNRIAESIDASKESQENIAPQSDDSELVQITRAETIARLHTTLSEANLIWIETKPGLARQAPPALITAHLGRPRPIQPKPPTEQLVQVETRRQDQLHD